MSDVARAAGVDKSTVSLALRDQSRVAPATRARVKAIAEQMGFRPDPTLAIIAAHRWRGGAPRALHTIAFIDPVPQEKRGSLLPRYFASVLERATKLGYHVERFPLHEYPSGASAGRVLFHRGIRRLLMAPLTRPETVALANLPFKDFTSVVCGSSVMDLPLHLVTQDTFQEVRMIWQEVVARGFTRIGIALLGHFPPVRDDLIRIGTCLALQRTYATSHGLPALELFTGRYQDEPEGFLRWFERERPQVIIGFNRQLEDWMREAGLRTPGDVHYASLRVVEGSGVSGVSPHWAAVGEAAVDLLDIESRTNPVGLPTLPRVVTVTPEWVEGKTLGTLV